MLGIRIRRSPIFLGLPDPDPDPLVRGTDPDLAPDPSRIERTESVALKLLLSGDDLLKHSTSGSVSRLGQVDYGT
jgi:hypothetical protein